MLVNIDWVRENFTDWGTYFLDELNAPSEDELENELVLAEAEFLRYVKIEAEDMTNSMRVHLLNIIRKRAFDRLNLTASFEFTPRVIIDYETTIKYLDKIRRGEIKEINNNVAIKITAKEKGEWFHP